MNNNSPWKKDIPHPAFPLLESDVPVWRYTDLAKFIWTLSNRKLYLCRADRLGDRFEGSVPQRDQSRMLDVMKNMGDKHGVVLSREEVSRQVSPRMRALRLAYIHSSYINCWRHGDESEAMWRLYCGQNEGVAMMTTFGRLNDSITDAATRLGAVNYLDYGSELLPDENWLQPIMHKRLAFKHEQEIRLFRWLQEETDMLLGSSGSGLSPKGHEMDWNPDITLDRVIISPFAPDWYSDVIHTVVAKFAPDLVEKVAWSELRADPIY
ncbi:MAG: DUF2971 domain-containing protein [Proteobacteria bacterium]|nr:DUF2971 domain-containing protein [Pseudomonadota bacterium]